jgi:hypothetical protein
MHFIIWSVWLLHLDAGARALTFLLVCILWTLLKWQGFTVACLCLQQPFDLLWYLFLFSSPLPCLWRLCIPSVSYWHFPFLDLNQTFRYRRIYRGWPPTRTWLVASMNRKWTLPHEVVLFLKCQGYTCSACLPTYSQCITILVTGTADYKLRYVQM